MIRRHRLGFTLIELLVVLSIIGIAASLVGPVALQQYERTKVTQEREQLLRLLDDLQFQAYTEFKSIHLMTEGNQMMLKAGLKDSNGTKTIKFDLIEFKSQSIELNSHGFWSNDFFYWFEASNERSDALNMPLIEQDEREGNDASR